MQARKHSFRPFQKQILTRSFFMTKIEAAKKEMYREKGYQNRKLFYKNTKQFERFSQKVQDHILASKEYTQADFICAYSAIHGEVLTNHLVEKAFKDKKTVLFPRCTAHGTGVMYYAVCTNFEDLEKGHYNILEPKAHCPIIQANVLNSQTTLVLVPALLFDQRGYRLGYGQGFFDRFLEQIPQAITVGLTFSELLAEEIPYMAWDQTVKFLATEEKMWQTGQV